MEWCWGGVGVPTGSWVCPNCLCHTVRAFMSRALFHSTTRKTRKAPRLQTMLAALAVATFILCSLQVLLLLPLSPLVLSVLYGYARPSRDALTHELSLSPSRHYYLLAPGQLRGCGHNEGLQLGALPSNPMARIGPSVWTPTPVPLPAAHPLVTTNAGRANIKKLTGSGLASALLTEDGQLYTWGTSKRGQLGHADASTQEAVPRLIQATPTRLHSDEAQKHAEAVVDVALGWGHGLALTSSHRVMAWGWGEQGQLGLGTYENVFTGPLEVEELSNKGIVSIAAGPDCSLAVTESGEVYLWGRNEYYLGLASSFLPTGEVTGENLPKKIEFPVRTEQGDEVQGKIIKVQAGFGHFLALTDEGKVWAFGLNSYGQLGLGDCVNRHNPHFVSSMKDEAIRDISCGRMHSLFLTKQGEVYACGLGKNGRLGTGETEDKCVPCLLPNLHSVQQIACGYDHSLVML